MKKRGFIILSCCLVLFVGSPFHLLDMGGFESCHVLAREGLSDAELYGNGQESILYPDSSQGERRGVSSHNNSSFTNKEVDALSDTDGNETTSRKSQNQCDISGDAKYKTIIPEDTQTSLMASGDAQSNVSASGDTKALSISGDTILKEDIVITGVEPDGVYNRDVTIGISAVITSEMVSVMAELYTVSGDSMSTDEGKREEALSTEATAAVTEEALDEEHTEQLSDSRRKQPGLQIGLSAAGQLVSGKQQVSEEGRYELLIWQEAKEGLELSEEQRILKKVGFTVDKTAPVIDRELINQLCRSEIDIEAICKKAVRDNSRVKISCFVNEQELSEGVIDRPGEYELIVKAEDEAGNRVQEQLQISLQDGGEEQEKRSRWMAPSVFVLLFGGSLLIREKRKEKKENEYKQRDK